MADLQELLDDLAAVLGRPVALEDRRWRLVAHSAHDGSSDSVRLASILARAAPPEVAAWLDGLGLDRADGPLVDVPANPALDMVERVCAPVREHDALLGFLWVIAAGEPLSPTQRDALVAAAGEAGRVLWRRRRQEEDERRAHDETLRALLHGDEREAAALALGLQHEWPDGARYAVLVAAGEPEVAQVARRRWDAGRLVSLVEPGRVVVLALLGPGERAGVDDALRVLREAGATHVAAGRERTDLRAAHDALAEAETTLRTIRAVPRLGPAGRFDALGSWGVIVAATGGTAAPPPAIARVLAEPQGPELLEALEAALDHADDISGAAASLSMSRATLYRRLRRVEELTGLRLADGDDRLHLHLGVRLWRLAGG